MFATALQKEIMVSADAGPAVPDACTSLTDPMILAARAKLFGRDEPKDAIRLLIALSAIFLFLASAVPSSLGVKVTMSSSPSTSAE